MESWEKDMKKPACSGTCCGAKLDAVLPRTNGLKKSFSRGGIARETGEPRTIRTSGEAARGCPPRAALGRAGARYCPGVCTCPGALVKVRDLTPPEQNAAPVRQAEHADFHAPRLITRNSW